jgi:hypothetical protein
MGRVSLLSLRSHNSRVDVSTMLIEMGFVGEAVRLPDRSRELQRTPPQERAIPQPPTVANVSPHSSTITQGNIIMAIDCSRNGSGRIEGMRGSFPPNLSEIKTNEKVEIVCLVVQAIANRPPVTRNQNARRVDECCVSRRQRTLVSKKCENRRKCLAIEKVMF